MATGARVMVLILLASILLSVLIAWISTGDVMASVSFSAVWTLAIASVLVAAGVATDRVRSRAHFLVAASVSLAVCDAVVCWLPRMWPMPGPIARATEGLGAIAIGALILAAVVALVRALLHRRSA